MRHLTEWVDGINDMLTESGILLDGTKYDERKVGTFKRDGLTNLLFPFDDTIKLNMGKLAMWRLQTHDQIGGFPASLCVNCEEGKASLALNHNLASEDYDVSAYERMCADFGIRECPDILHLRFLIYRKIIRVPPTPFAYFTKNDFVVF